MVVEVEVELVRLELLPHSELLVLQQELDLKAKKIQKFATFNLTHISI